MITLTSSTRPGRRLALGSRHQFLMSAIDLSRVSRPPLKAEPLPEPDPRDQELAALRARVTELEAAQRQTIERAQREDRVRSAPGFHEVDRIAQWRARSGLARLTVKVVITSQHTAIIDSAP